MTYVACVFASLLALTPPLPVETTPAGPEVLQWEQLPPLPDTEGFAGAFTGVSNGVLIVAGGANFPKGRPWEGGKKVWYDSVFVLESPATKGSRKGWQTGFKLPRPLGYGVSLTTADNRSVVCIGGGDGKKHYADVFRLEWIDGRIKVTELPPMPRPSAFFCGAMVDNTIYVAGGRESPDAPRALRTFWALDLSKKPGELRWVELEPWPGPERMLAVAAAQAGSFLLISGAKLDPDKPGDDKRVFLRDGYCYNPANKRTPWKRIADVPRAVVAAPTPAVPLGRSLVAVLGGVNATTPTVKVKDAYTGCPAEILCYNLSTDTWTTCGELPKDPAKGFWPPITTGTTLWNGRVVVPSGEIKAGVRTPNVLLGKPLIPR